MPKRFIPLDQARIRAEGDDGKIRGISPLYFSLSVDLGGWREMNLPGAFEDREDPVATFNHNYDMILGRESAGTLAFSDTDDGLTWEIDTPDTSAGRDLKVSLERRDVQGASYTFMPKEGGEKFTEVGDAERALTGLGVPETQRSRALSALDGLDGSEVVAFIAAARLYEVGPVVNPAYPESDARQSRSAFEEWSRDREKGEEVYTRDREAELRLQSQRLRL